MSNHRDEADTDVRYCNCVDPENCTSAVPGLICKAGHTVWETPQADGGSEHD